MYTVLGVLQSKTMSPLHSNCMILHLALHSVIRKIFIFRRTIVIQLGRSCELDQEYILYSPSTEQRIPRRKNTVTFILIEYSVSIHRTGNVSIYMLKPTSTLNI